MRIDTSAAESLIWIMMVALLCAGCGGSDAGSGTGGGAAPTTCVPGELPPEEGACPPPGLPPDMQCNPGERAADDGSCAPAGVPPDECAPGFELDGDGGCAPILPAEPCPAGKTAMLGETECHDVSPCSGKKWGGLEAAATALFVDGTAPVQGNGTEAAPFKTIQAALVAASPGTTIAIAPGVYEEDLLLETPDVTLAADCPTAVTIAGTGAASHTVEVDAAGVELQNVGITGPHIGLAVYGAIDVALRTVHVHDTGDDGVHVTRHLGAPAAIEIEGSLIENATGAGVRADGARLVLRESTVRRTKPSGGYTPGGVIADIFVSTPPEVEVRSSVVSENAGGNIVVRSAKLLVEGSLVERATTASPYPGYGVYAMTKENKPPSSVEIRGSVIREHITSRVLLSSSNGTMVSSVLRDTVAFSSLAQKFGAAALIAADPDTGLPSSFTLERSIVDNNEGVGVYISGSDATVSATLLQRTRESPSLHAYGMLVDSDPTRAHVQLHDSVLDGNQGAALTIVAADIAVAHTRVSNTAPGLSEESAGFGILAMWDPGSGATSTVVIDQCIIESNSGGGVLGSESDLVMKASIVRGTSATPNAPNGNGVHLSSDDAAPGVPTLTVDACDVRDNDGLGILTSRAGVLIRCSNIASNGKAGLGALESNASVKAVRLESNHGAALLGYASDVSLSCSVLGSTAPLGDEFGAGAGAQGGRLSVADTAISDCHYYGIGALDTDLSVARTSIEGILPQKKDERFGDGIVTIVTSAPTPATIAETTVDGCARAGIAAFGAEIQLRAVELTCNAIDFNTTAADFAWLSTRCHGEA